MFCFVLCFFQILSSPAPTPLLFSSVSFSLISVHQHGSLCVSLRLCVSLFISLSQSLNVSASVSLSLCLYFSPPLSDAVFVSITVSLCLCLSVSLSSALFALSLPLSGPVQSPWHEDMGESGLAATGHLRETSQAWSL